MNQEFFPTKTPEERQSSHDTQVPHEGFIEGLQRYARVGALSATLLSSPVQGVTGAEDVGVPLELDSPNTLVSDEVPPTDSLVDENDPLVRIFRKNQERERYEQLITERCAQGFEHEQDLYDFYHALALQSPFEHALYYGVTDQGKLVIIQHMSGDDISIPIAREDAKLNGASAQDIPNLRFLHTHPVASNEAVLQVFDLKDVDHLHAPMPFSVPDLNMAIRFAWKNRIRESESSYNIPGTHSFVSEIVDGTGVWTYEVNPDHPYVHQVLSEREQGVVDSENGKNFGLAHPELSREEFIELIRTLNSPDPLVFERALDGAVRRGLADDKALLGLVMTHAQSGVVGENNEFEVTNQQLQVFKSGAQRKAAIEKFIEFFRARGVTVTYTPFTQNETKE